MASIRQRVNVQSPISVKRLMLVEVQASLAYRASRYTYWIFLTFDQIVIPGGSVLLLQHIENDKLIIFDILATFFHKLNLCHSQVLIPVFSVQLN
jgi:hypothetical protein